MKRIPFAILLLLVTLLASCHSDSCKIDCEIVNTGSGDVRVVYSDSTICEEQITPDQKGRFTIKLASPQPMLVHLLDHRGEPLATVVAVNGDHLKIKGDASKPLSIKVKGNRLNEDWQLFRDEHAAFYSDPNPSRLDAAIEKYVREHPDDMLSTVLLVADYSDYSDRSKLATMFKSIAAESRPESLLRGIPGNPLQDSKNAHLPRLMTVMLVKHGGDFEEIKLTDRIHLLSLWANPQKDRNALINKLQDLDENIRLIDVLAESDTLRWHQTIMNDPKGWQHYWAPGGPLEQGLQLLSATTMPWYAVTDSTGMVTYSGPSLDSAKKSASSLLNQATR